MSYSKGTQQTYDAIAQAYAGENKEPSGELAAFRDRAGRHYRPNSRLLDLGCGPGNDSNFFAQQGYVVVGLDLSIGMLSQAAPGKVALVQGSMSEMPFAVKTFDSVWSSFALMHLPLEEQEKALQEIKRVMRPGGLAFIATVHGVGSFNEQVVYSPEHTREYYPQGVDSFRRIAKKAKLSTLEIFPGLETGKRPALYAVLRRPWL